MEFDDVSRRTAKAINDIVQEYEYEPIPTHLQVGSLADVGYLKGKFLCHDNATCINEVDAADAEIVTGFGPTNAPTAGTLSVILKALALQRYSQLTTSVIISDLGAWNSRNMAWPELERLTGRYIEFLTALGFNQDMGMLRSHRDHRNLEVSAWIARLIDDADFEEHREATDALYDLMNLRGPRFGIKIDILFTIADILNPVLSGKRRVLVLAGIEEHYFTRLSRIVAARIAKSSLCSFIASDTAIGGLYARLVGGLPPFPKMSKSIPESGISVAESIHDIRRKILDTQPEAQPVILQMVELVSDWSPADVAQARAAFENRTVEPADWMGVKESYLEYFLRVARIWQRL